MTGTQECRLASGEDLAMGLAARVGIEVERFAAGRTICGAALGDPLLPSTKLEALGRAGIPGDQAGGGEAV